MVELLNDFPPHVAAYVARDKVHKQEYEKLVMKRVAEIAERYGAINFLVKLETEVDNYALATFVDYLKMTVEHFKQWNKMAIVSDEKWIRLVYDALSPLLHGSVKTYALHEYEAARHWVSEPL
jgi:hypothetical protein